MRRSERAVYVYVASCLLATRPCLFATQLLHTSVFKISHAERRALAHALSPLISHRFTLPFSPHSTPLALQRYSSPDEHTPRTHNKQLGTSLPNTHTHTPSCTRESKTGAPKCLTLPGPLCCCSAAALQCIDRLVIAAAATAASSAAAR